MKVATVRERILDDYAGKEQLLMEEIKKMLKAENPLQGIYGIYGDHPNEGDIRNELKLQKLGIPKLDVG